MYFYPMSPEKSTCDCKCFFNEVKYLLRKCEMFADANVANFISHCDEGVIFHNFLRKLFNIQHRRIFHLKQ